MALASAVQGAKRPSQTIVWQDQDRVALNLTGATITARIKNSEGVTVASDGTFTIVTAASGIFRWDYGTNDVANAGSYTVQFNAAFGTDPTPAKSITAEWLVYPAI